MTIIKEEDVSNVPSHEGSTDVESADPSEPKDATMDISASADAARAEIRRMAVENANIPPPYGDMTKQLALTGNWGDQDMEQVQSTTNDHELRLDSLEICVGHLMEELEDKAMEKMATRLEKRILEKVLAMQEKTEGDGKDDDDDDDGTELSESDQKTLTEDTFSFVLSSKTCSPPFLLGMVVVSLQVAIFILVGLNTLDISDGNNPFGVPINVSEVVRITQLVAIFIAVLLQHDLFTCFDLIRDGYSEHLRKAFPHATLLKFVFTAAIRFFEGALCLLLMFVLIVQSESVLDVLLNFTAVEFVSQFDEAFFYLASQGFLGRYCEDEATNVTDTPYFSENVRFQRFRKFVLMMVALVTLLLGWGILIEQQKAGRFVCSTIIVQFDDSMIPELGTFSGLYDKYVAPRNGLGSKRVEYIERRSGRAKFAYCDDIEAWTFRWYQAELDDIEDDPCEWVARSSPTETFDLTETSEGDWFIQDEHNRVVVLDHFFLACNDCDDNDCNDRGECENAVCTCESNYTGLNCEFAKPCPTLATDVRHGDFPGDRDWSSQFKLLRHGNEPVLSYHRPVYVYFGRNAEFELLFFTGRRWVASHNNYLPDVGKDTSNIVLSLIYFFRNFHAHYSLYRVGFISEPMDIGTENDAVTPIGISWAQAKSKPANETGIQEISLRDVETILLCSFCDEEILCRYDGVCNEGTCTCSIGSEGSVCEKAPTGNGHCDPHYNREIYDYDGGDCCSFSCESSEDFKCGMDVTGYIPQLYPFCKVQTPGLWHLNGDGIEGQQDADFGHHIAISESGNILLVTGASLDQGYHIFDNDGKNWNLRYESKFAGSVKKASEVQIVEEKYRVESKASRVVPVTVSIFVAPDFNEDTPGQIFIFDCESQCGSVRHIENVWYADMARSGVIAIATGDHYSNISFVAVHDSRSYEDDSPPSTSFWGSHDELLEEISISDDGRTIALLTAEATETDRGDHRRFIQVYTADDGTEYRKRGSSIYMDDRGQNDPADFSRLALSQNGDVLAIVQCDAWHRVIVYAWNDDGADWAPIESPPVGTGGIECRVEAENVIRPALSLSGRQTMVFSDFSEVETPKVDNSVYVFGWSVDVGWEILGQKLPGGPINAVSMSNDGFVLAHGSPLERDDGLGLAKVYSRPKTAWCPPRSSSFRLSMAMDEGEGDTRWFLVQNATKEIILAGVVPYNYEPIVADTCLQDLESECYELLLFDEFNEDGIAEPGGFALYLDGKKLPVKPYDHGPVKHIWIGNCQAQPSASERCGSYLSYLQIYSSPKDSVDSFKWSLFDFNTDEVILQQESSNRSDEVLREQHICVNIEERCLVLTLIEGPNERNLISDFIHVGLDGEGLEHDKDIHEERFFLGENKCCPASLARFSAIIRVCESAAWTVSTMDGEVLATGSAGENHGGRLLNATANACNPHTDPVDVYFEDLCLDPSQCYYFSFVGDHTGAALSSVMPYSYWQMATRPGGAYFGTCESNSTIEIEPIHLADGVPLYGQATNPFFSPQYTVGPVSEGREVTCTLEGKIWDYAIETRWNATNEDGHEFDEHVHTLGTRTCTSQESSSEDCSSGDAPPGGALLLVTVETGSFTNVTITCTSCEDLVAGWHDVTGVEFTCAWYRQSNRCSLYGGYWPNMGYTANEACCGCGGGQIPRDDNSTNIEIVQESSPCNETSQCSHSDGTPLLEDNELGNATDALVRGGHRPFD
ncbi:expressed unknown protein [Seminavis robusta]|uniref:EGF-like domain-containing protein n=1 Tax=Seminavis robusta TaxID=568900 RepID=A0A9N8DDE4_9STRA|nr:expressed unknown protein [Seminavis robusta]|eukprot:Sro43_g026310.1 n/a (1710) ;mRNA; f:114167-119864